MLSFLFIDSQEEFLYTPLPKKRVLSKNDTGRPRDDFHLDILGYLGNRPDSQNLYKQLIDTNYQRTEKEMQRMIEEAVRAHSSLNSLTQDLIGFNLEYYKELEGRYSLEELGEWVRDTILKLSGSAIPAGEFCILITPEPLKQAYDLAPGYEKICFSRELDMRTWGSELGGVDGDFLLTPNTLKRKKSAILTSW